MSKGFIGTKRGALIVFEGCDRSGKTTQCQRIVSHLNQLKDKGDEANKSVMMRFPDRTTQMGMMIDNYLKGSENLDDHVIHLLFSANRWEKASEMKDLLNTGVNVFIDRYAFSGVAFSAAKEDMSIEWCKQPDSGLPRPDLVCFLDVSPEEAAKRGGFGEERYETSEFQKIVRANYNELMCKEYWRLINTDGKSPDEVFKEVTEIVGKVVQTPREEDLLPLWPNNIMN